VVASNGTSQVWLAVQPTTCTNEVKGVKGSPDVDGVMEDLGS
jgi:hypothetical protein